MEESRPNALSVCFRVLTMARKRINMRVPEDLVVFIKKYAVSNGTTMTDDYVKYLEEKKKQLSKEPQDVQPT